MAGKLRSWLNFLAIDSIKLEKPLEQIALTSSLQA